MSYYENEPQNGHFLEDIFGDYDNNFMQIEKDLEDSKRDIEISINGNEYDNYLDYMTRGLTYCVCLPKNVSLEKFKTWLSEVLPEDLPAIVRLYIEKGLEQESLKKVKSIINKHVKRTVFITCIHSVSSEDIEKMQIFANTIYPDEQG